MPKQIFYWPVYPVSINQGFGEDKACVSADGKKTVNKESWQTCPEGFKSLYSQTNGHNGLDLQASRWQPVYAAQDGTVVEVQTEEARGLGIGLIHSLDGRFYLTRYWHLAAIDIHLGDFVKAGFMLGYADSTGYSSGDHLHFELKECDAKGRVLNYANTHLGAIDPLPYMIPVSDNGFKKSFAERIAQLVDKVADLLRKR